MTNVRGFCDIRFFPVISVLLIFFLVPAAAAAGSGDAINGTIASEPLSSLAGEDSITPDNWVASLWSGFCGLFGARVDEAPEEPVAIPTTLPSDNSSPSEVETIPTTDAEDSSPEPSDLTVISEPEGALISIDGEYTGKTTPAILHDLSPGTHTVSLAAEGAAPFDAVLSLSGEQTLTVDFSADSYTLLDGLVEVETYDGTGSIFVNSKPDGATIVLDGRELQWRTPHVVSGIKPGIHKVSVKEGWVDFPVSAKQCLVESGMVTSVVFDQEQHSSRSVTVKSEIFDKAELTVNGIRLKLKVPATVEISDISSFVSVRDDAGYYSFLVSAFLEDGAEFVLEEPAPATAGVRVVSEPAGAEIFVDGFDTGYATPYTIEDVSNGPHLIAVSRPGYIPAEQRILLADDPGTAEDAALSFILEGYPYGSLTISSDSEGAKIYLYGKDTGEVTPHTFRYLRIGTYDVKIIFSGASQSRDDVTVLPGGDTLCQFDL